MNLYLYIYIHSNLYIYQLIRILNFAKYQYLFIYIYIYMYLFIYNLLIIYVFIICWGPHSLTSFFANTWKNRPISGCIPYPCCNTERVDAPSRAAPKTSWCAAAVVLGARKEHQSSVRAKNICQVLAKNIYQAWRRWPSENIDKTS